MEVKENIIDSSPVIKESPASDDGDEGIDMTSCIDKGSEPSEMKAKPEGTLETENDLETNGIEPSETKAKPEGTLETENDLETNGIENSNQGSNGIAEESDSDDEMFRKKRSQKKKAIVSDDEESDNPLSQVSTQSKKESESSKKSGIESSNSDDSDDESLSIRTSKKKKKKMRIINSDDSDDELVSVKDSKKKNKRVINSDSEEDSDMEMFSKAGKSQSQEATPSYNRNIYDTVDSDDEDRRSRHSDEGDRMDVSSNKKNPKEPTKKDRERDRLEIASESQRMQREATFSLPYHKPKQRSLAEFLNRRKSAAPIANTMKETLKMSMRNPEILKRMESRKAEVEEFYKSDDEGAEDPEDGEWKPGMEPKRSESDKDSDDDMETDADKSVAENKLDSAPSESKDNGISLNASEIVKQSCKEIVSSESIDEKTNDTPGSLMDDNELPDIDNIGKDQNLKCNEDPSEMNSTSTKENMEIEGRDSSTQLDKTEESKSEEQMDEAEGKAPDELTKDTFKYDISSTVSSKILVNDSGIQSGASSSNEDHDSNDSTKPISTSNDKDNEDQVSNESIKATSTSIEKDNLAETNTQGEEITVAEIINKDISLQGTPSHQNKDSNSTENNTPKLDLLASKFPTLDLKATPKLGLGAASGDFIDLEEDLTPKDNKAGFSGLLDRFLKHSKTKRAKAGKRQVNVGIVQKVKDADGQENLESSSICIELESDEDHTITEEIPGAKRVTLRTALKAKMREQREQGRLKRAKQKRFMDEEDVEGEEEILDDEGDFTDKSETDCETESEPEENDVVIKDKKRKKSKFLEEEADDDEMEDETGENEGEEEENDDAAADINDDDDSNDTVVLGSRASKKLTINEDDDSDTNGEDLHLEWENTQDVNKEGLHRTETQDMFASQSNDKPPKKIDSVEKDSSMTSMDSSFEFFGSVIPAHQPGGGMKNPRSHLNSESQDTSNAGFLTPLLKHHKTDSFGSVSKGCDLSLPFENSQDLCSTAGRMSGTREGSPSPARDQPLQLTPMENSQFASGESSSSPGAKLRLDFVGATQSQQGGAAADELVGLCSGQFNGKTQVNKESNLYDDDDDMAPTQNIDDLMGLCSGQFNTQATGDVDKKKSKVTTSGAFSELFDSRSKSTMEDDDLIGLCTGKFTTQKDPSESTNDGVTAEEENSDTESKPHKMIIDSDDEDLVNKLGDKEKKKQKRKRKRIVAFGSDDEDDNAVDFVPDFDDEENEARKEGMFSSFKDKSTGGIRKDFLDAEAELSGSEDEVSDDEDECGEDILEMEAGDAENYDENELRDQVGRAHMKAEMDADKKKLRLLQEMYLENGELHGEGRQRTFKWANKDENDDNNQRVAVSDEEDHNEEETDDAEWRKERFEREKFLLEQNEKLKDDENEPEMFKIGPALVRMKSVKATKREPLKPSNPPATTPTSTTNPTAANTQPTVPSNPFCMPTKRGSFLSRNKSALAKIAEFNKDKGSTIGGAKQGGNFVFQQLSTEEVEAKQEQAETKLNRSISAPAMKRARLDRSFFSQDEAKQKTSLFKLL